MPVVVLVISFLNPLISLENLVDICWIMVSICHIQLCPVCLPLSPPCPILSRLVSRRLHFLNGGFHMLRLISTKCGAQFIKSLDGVRWFTEKYEMA